MKLLDRLEQKFGRYAVPHLTMFIIALQVVMYLLASANPAIFDNAALIPRRVLEGEYYRVLSFVIMPPNSVGALSAVWAFFYWYLLYLFGSTLENHWGAFRYNVFLLVGFIATVAAAFLQPGSVVPVSNGFLYGTIFLAFARLNPDFELMLFFVLPVKVKWLALVAWIGYGLSFTAGVLGRDWLLCATILASVLNYLLFFGRDIGGKVKFVQRQAVRKAREVVVAAEPFHRCEACGATERSHPGMEFRYDGGKCYCRDHINDRR